LTEPRSWNHRFLARRSGAALRQVRPAPLRLGRPSPGVSGPTAAAAQRAATTPPSSTSSLATMASLRSGQESRFREGAAPGWVPPGRVALQVHGAAARCSQSGLSHCHQSRSGSWPASSSADLRALRAAWQSAHSSSATMPSTSRKDPRSRRGAVQRGGRKQVRRGSHPPPRLSGLPLPYVTPRSRRERPFRLRACCNADAVSNAHTRDGFRVSRPPQPGAALIPQQPAPHHSQHRPASRGGAALPRPPLPAREGT
jgi:hypothetical protein